MNARVMAENALVRAETAMQDADAARHHSDVKARSYALVADGWGHLAVAAATVASLERDGLPLPLPEGAAG